MKTMMMLVVLLGLLALVVWLWSRYGKPKSASPLSDSVEHATGKHKDLPTVKNRESLPKDGVVLGRVLNGEAVGHRVVATTGTTGIVVGPTGAGKTQKVLLPAVLRQDGPLLTTSTKDELAAEAVYVGLTKGRVSVLDPAGVVSHDSLTPLVAVWTPLQGCSDWQETAKAVAQLAMSESGDVWKEQATALMTAVFWLLRRFPGTSLADMTILVEALRTAKDAKKEEEALPKVGDTFQDFIVYLSSGVCSGWEAGRIAVDRWAKDEKVDSADAGLVVDVLLSMESIAGAEETIAGVIFSFNAIKNSSLIYASHAYNRKWDDPENLDLNDWARSDSDSLFIVSPDSAVHFMGYFCSFINASMSALDSAAWAQPDRTLPKRALLVLDELANICPLPDLPSWLSTKRSQNIAFLLGLQGFSQLVERYTEDGYNTIVNNSNMFVMGLAGSQDNKTVEHFSKFAGERLQEIKTKSKSVSKPKGVFTDDKKEKTTESISENVSASYRSLATPYGLFQMNNDEAVVLIPSRRFARVKTLPAYADEELRTMRREAKLSVESALSEAEARALAAERERVQLKKRKEREDYFASEHLRRTDDTDNFAEAFGDHTD